MFWHRIYRHHPLPLAMADPLLPKILAGAATLAVYEFGLRPIIASKLGRGFAPEKEETEFDEIDRDLDALERDLDDEEEDDFSAYY